ncbi:hypothetical protein E6W39_35165 [Kitasatospora acidiphila]|uniref:DUF6895 domain-containing protein n=1 Tax=Kitasatospora acidiphila TaxID=2567942 RepID=A0A540WBR9_9ACTN|nr:hypothetical protein [Kitasatospora acidiphila]TQF06480.1 hypothetical protein E6W39_35165 [Kitasatospora acidiphila]
MDVTTVRQAQQVADQALAWLGRMRANFALPRDVPHWEIDGDSLKAISELAMAAAIIRREAVAGPQTAQTADELLDFAWREFGSGELLHTLQQHTPPATHPTEIYSAFTMAGLRHQLLEELAAYLAGLRAAAVTEHVPNRRLAVLAARRRLGLPDPPDVPGLIAQTWLGGTPEPWMLDTFNAYGVTHTVFHLTDWAANPDGLDPRLQEYLHRWLPVWVEVFTETRSWDLLGELLIVDVCLSEPDWYPHAWEQLAAAQHEDGMVPNGVTRPPSDPDRAFRNHHHPTIVAAVAGTLTVSRALAVAS